MPFEFQARCDPRNLGFAEAKQAYLRMTGLEYLEYFRKVSLSPPDHDAVIADQHCHVYQ